MTLDSTSYLPPWNAEKYSTSASTTHSQAILSYSSQKWDNTRISLTRGFYSIIQTESPSSTVDTPSFITRKEYTTNSIIGKGRNGCTFSLGETILSVSTSLRALQNQKHPRGRQEYLGNNISFPVDKEALHLNLRLDQLDHPRQPKRRASTYLHCNSSNRHLNQ